MSSPETAPNTRFWRLLTMVLLVLAICGFGAVTLCGGVFSVVAASDGGGGYAAGIWTISLPSLLIGAWLCYLCARQLRKVWRALDRAAEER
jgi:hypothetical protein